MKIEWEIVLLLPDKFKVGLLLAASKPRRVLEIDAHGRMPKSILVERKKSSYLPVFKSSVWAEGFRGKPSLSCLSL